MYTLFLLLKELQATESPETEEEKLLTLRGGVDDDVDPAPPANGADAEAYFQAHGLPNVLEDDEGAEDAGEEATLDAWPLERLLKPLYPGCEFTVQQFCYALFRLKTGSIHDDRADLLCKLFAQVMPVGYEGPKCELRTPRR